MIPYTTLEIERRPAAAHQAEGGPQVAWVWMNKPALHNAFDETLIAELSAALQLLDADAAVRVIVLAGRGKSFSAGADLNWMQRQAAASQAENIADAERLAGLFHTLSTLAKPTIARVHGAALGGGMGLASTCDICVASDRAVFATSEVRFGIIPAAISPYVIRAIGERQAYRYFQTAERIDAQRAHTLGLVHELSDEAGLDMKVQALVDALLAGGPQAQAAATDLIRAVANRPVTAEVIADTARRIATLRATDEAREGLAAFLAKRPAAWVPH
ncbi:MAG: hypothetical protein RLY71_3374 [Pseudomonadota bacterium]|jgi:methylglutaconyl-CoA hydratase